MYYEPECRDDFALGKKIKNVSEILLKQATLDINESGLDCSHVVYNDLIKNPLKVVKDIYKQFNWTYTDEYDEILKTYLKKNDEEREAIKCRNATNTDHNAASLHTYTPEEFGLTSTELCTGEFDEYCKLYNVPMSKS